MVKKVTTNPRTGSLTTRQVKEVTKPGRYADGGNLYLQVQVSPDGRTTKSWIFRYMARGQKRREMGLGSAGEVSLLAARAKAAECRRLLSNGIDPLEERDRSVHTQPPTAPGSEVRTNGHAGSSRQASKSNRTRIAVLDATLECLARLPYPEVTISAVAERAGVSKGGIQYHFPSRQELLRQAVGHLFERRLDAYRADLDNAPPGITITDHIIENHWKHLTEPTFQIYQELVLASRSDAELRKLLVERYRWFRRQWSRLSLERFGWDATDPEVLHLGNIAQYLLEGMAYGWFAEQLGEDDVEPLLDFAKSLLRKGLQQTTDRRN